MTVNELMEELWKQPGDEPVRVGIKRDGYLCELVPAKSVKLEEGWNEPEPSIVVIYG